MERKWWTLVAVCAGTFMLLLDVTIVVVAQPAIQSGLKASFSDVQWILDAYALTLAALLLTAGVLADRYGRKLLFAIGVVIFTLGSLACGLSVNPLMLIISRSGQGVGGAIMFATSLALLGNSFRGKERGTAFGVWGAVVGISTALGPVLGGVITTNWDWRGIFLVNVPIGAFALIVTIWAVAESKVDHPSPPDWIGFVLLTAGLVGVVYGLIRAGETSWTNQGMAISLAAGVVLLIAFIVAEKFVRYPMFDLSLFRVPTFAGGSIAGFCMNGSLFALQLYLVLYLQDILGYSAQDAGLRLAIISLAQLVTAIIAGRASAHVPVRWLIGPGLLIVGVGIILMTRLNGDSSWTHLLAGFIVSGLGTGLVNPPLASTAIGVVPPHQAGMASGANTTFRQVGIACGIAALGSIFTARLQNHLAGALPPSLSGSAASMASAVRQGSVARVIGSVPAADRAAVGLALKSSFASGLNDILYVTAGVAIVGAVFGTLLIRGKDFHRPEAPAPGAEAAGPDLTVPSPEPGAVTAPVAEPAGLAAPVSGHASANGAAPGRLAVFGYVRHGEGSPLAGATVTLVGPDGHQAGLAHSGPDGRYQVPVSAEGTYTLIAMAASHEPYASAIRVGGQPAEVDMLLAGGASLSGVVRTAVTGEPVPGVTATLADERGEVVGTALTRDDGGYALASLPDGRYTLVISAPSYQPAALPAVISGGQPATLDVELRTGARAGGIARTGAGRPVPEARVTLLDPEGSVAGVTTTAADGTYSFENLPEGEYTVIAAGYPPAASRLKVTGGDVHVHDVELGHPEA
ncbi:MAG: DHA2 family efflux MFS transporter permease subunit [Streptosporangiales bacterium]|nr:DHA2 family efflux MFS transporter permease subunit [Streptosporangiales bacterium]